MGDMSPRRAQRGRAATKENGNFHHEAHEGHEGKEIRRNFVPNFVLFVSFVVICKFSQSAQIFKYSTTKSTKVRAENCFSGVRVLRVLRGE